MRYLRFSLSAMCVAAPLSSGIESGFIVRNIPQQAKGTKWQANSAKEGDQQKQPINGNNLRLKEQNAHPLAIKALAGVLAKNAPSAPGRGHPAQQKLEEVARRKTETAI